MAKRIKQYRYYANDSESNFPAGLNLEALATGSAFEGHIIDLKIQSYPGTKFYLNDSTDSVMVVITTDDIAVDLLGFAELIEKR